MPSNVGGPRPKRGSPALPGGQLATPGDHAGPRSCPAAVVGVEAEDPRGKKPFGVDARGQAIHPRRLVKIRYEAEASVSEGGRSHGGGRDRIGGSADLRRREAYPGQVGKLAT